MTYRVVKNRLMRIAAEDNVGAAALSRCSWAQRRSPSARTRRHGQGHDRRHAAVHRIVKITGGVLGDRAIDADGVSRLATLPSREVLSQSAGAFAAPMATTAGLFDAPLRDVVGLVAALAERGRSSLTPPETNRAQRGATRTGEDTPWPR